MLHAGRREAARMIESEDGVRTRLCLCLRRYVHVATGLYRRSGSLAGIRSLLQTTVRVKCGIVTIVFTAGRSQLAYVTESVACLCRQLLGRVNGIVRETFVQERSGGSDVDAELACGVKELHDVLWT